MLIEDIRNQRPLHQNLSSYIFSTSSRHINVILTCNWSARVVVKHPNHKYEVIYFFLEIHSLNPEILLSLHFLTPLHLFDQLSMDRRRDRNGPDISGVILVSERQPDEVLLGTAESQQQHAYDQAQRGARAGAGRRRSQAYNLTMKEVQASGKVVTGCDA